MEFHFIQILVSKLYMTPVCIPIVQSTDTVINVKIITLIKGIKNLLEIKNAWKQVRDWVWGLSMNWIQNKDIKYSRIYSLLVFKLNL